ncbi:hypothetical protein IQ268_04970 [Oculatella sp. LEGE 06141]|uniref:hypothetical protein n=1 Tax=Oculatella sp. LEGE 06141 TaxID=1828648 RepID=UPI00187F8C51|nr:hypothetical protein [Oculatella sp. LEGE 06141]MBE9177935.1 hypothetical protein [Oculatella sp. LEGE 06141]
MKVWLTCFLLLFAIAELYQWITNTGWMSHFHLPLPVLMLAGAGLAIASNYDKQAGLPWQMYTRLTQPSIAPNAPSTAPATAAHPSQAADSASAAFNPSQQNRSISFTIQKPNTPRP